jgi:hypothetical protein
MSAAQKKAQANFKKAIAYRKKTGCSLKEAFASVKGFDGVTKKGNKTTVHYSKAAAPKKAAKKAVKHVAPKKKVVAKKETKQGKLFGVGNLFDTSVIKDLDSLKKQYYKLSKKYHPDAGGTTSQFQQLQQEYEDLFNKVLKGGNLNTEQQQNEVVIDKAIRDIIDNLINLQGLTVEVVGKWLWIGGDTYPVRTILKQAGLTFIKKDGKPFWVYKGVESTSRGQMSLDEIKRKYGVTKFDIPQTKKIMGVVKFNRIKLKKSLSSLKRGLDRRPI